jgi:hypothetical protein
LIRSCSATSPASGRGSAACRSSAARPGWLTNDIGFNLIPGVARADALQALERFAFKQLGCLQLEIADRHLASDDGARIGFQMRAFPSHVSDLTLPEEEIFARMSTSTRWSIRKAERNGLQVEVAEPEGFAEDFYPQFAEVFAKQGLRPPYPIERVQRMIELCRGSGDLLLVWGNGSRREFQKLRPNEALHWFALRYWKARGMALHDWGGADPARRNTAARSRCCRCSGSRPTRWSSTRAPALKLRNLPRRLRSRRYRQKVQQAS